MIWRTGYHTFDIKDFCQTKKDKCFTKGAKVSNQCLDVLPAGQPERVEKLRRKIGIDSFFLYARRIIMLNQIICLFISKRWQNRFYFNKKSILRLTQFNWHRDLIYLVVSFNGWNFPSIFWYFIPFSNKVSIFCNITISARKIQFWGEKDLSGGEIVWYSLPLSAIVRAGKSHCCTP